MAFFDCPWVGSLERDLIMQERKIVMSNAFSILARCLKFSVYKPSSETKDYIPGVSSYLQNTFPKQIFQVAFTSEIIDQSFVHS